MDQNEILIAGFAALVVMMAWGLQRLSRKFPDKARSEGRSLFPLWVAQGFGAGQIPWAPGTLGSVVGMGWFALLVWSQNWVVLGAGIVLSFPLSVWLCGEAEVTMGEKDPGPVVIDEVAAIPVCFVAWAWIAKVNTGGLPGPGYFYSQSNWPLALGVFALFRFFDVVKPWPVRQSQSLPGGWGVTVDDFLAAVYVNLVVVGVWFGHTAWSRSSGE